jgi:hypothetical protein
MPNSINQSNNNVTVINIGQESKSPMSARPASPISATSKSQWRSQNELASPTSPLNNSGMANRILSGAANTLRNVLNYRPGSANNIAAASAPTSPDKQQALFSPIADRGKHRRNPTTLPSPTDSDSRQRSLDRKTAESTSPRRASASSVNQSGSTVMRNVSGWFLNVSTTSTKAPEKLMEQLLGALRSLESCGLRFDRDHLQAPWIVNVEVQTMEFMQSTKDTGSVQAGINGSNSSDDAASLDEEGNRVKGGDTDASPPMAASVAGNRGAVTFQIEICKVPKLNLHGLYFKRLNGSMWSYKKVCGRLLPYFKL